MNLYHGDCLEIMPSLPAQSVDAVICDIPSGRTACAWDVAIPFDAMWANLKRLIKPRGAIVLLGCTQPFTSMLVMSNPKMFRYEWIWHKNKGSNFQGLRYGPFREHESVLVFSREAHIFNPILQERTASGLSRIRYAMPSGRGINPITGLSTITKPQQELRHPSSVQSFPCEMGLHPTQKPVALMEYLIRTYTNEGDTVLDFAAGSGTTGVACVNTGRDFIGIEKDLSYYETAQRRITEAQQAMVQMELVA